MIGLNTHTKKLKNNNTITFKSNLVQLPVSVSPCPFLCSTDVQCETSFKLTNQRMRVDTKTTGERVQCRPWGRVRGREQKWLTL